MDYIFEHEKLRMDEIMKRVSAKNNFTPLKPLRSSNFTLLRSSIDDTASKPKKLQKLALNLKSNQTRDEVPLISLLLPKYIEDPIQKPKKEFIYEYKSLDSSVSEKQNIPKPMSKEKPKKIFPTIHRNLAVIEKPNENMRKNSQSLIAYVPTVAYIMEKEEKDIFNGKKTGYTKNFSLLQNHNFIRDR